MPKGLSRIAISNPERAKTRLAKIPPTRLAQNQAPAPKESQAQTVIALPLFDLTASGGRTRRRSLKEAPGRREEQEGRD
jgi:hypothetical protein